MMQAHRNSTYMGQGIGVLNPVASQSMHWTSGDLHQTLHSLRFSMEVTLQIPGVPVMYLQSHKYTIERLPEATMGGAPRT
jgi:hypothetical protein